MKKVSAAVLALCFGGLMVCWLAGSFRTGEEWQLNNITGHLPDLRFSLVADNGQPVTEQAYRGDVVLLYFGFTGCATQCPLTMGRLSEIIQKLGSDAKHIHVLFVTVNPQNDTPQALHSYLASFDAEHMIGLTGSSQPIEALAKRCRVAYRPDYSGAGDIPHSNVVYIFDAHGRARLLAAPEDSDEKILHDLNRLSHGEP